MWRSSGKFTTSCRTSARRFSLKQNSGNRIEKVIQKPTNPNALRYLSTNATGGGTGAGGKVVIGTTVITGAVAGGLYYANNNEAFRKNVENKLPFSASIFNAIIGKSKASTNLRPPFLPNSQIRENSENQLFSREGDKDVEPLPFVKDPVLTPELRVKKSIEPSRKEVPEKKMKGKTEPLAAVSSVDQMAVSLVDLDISKSVEKEIMESEVHESETEKTTKSGEKNKKEENKGNEELIKTVNEEDMKLEIKESNEMTKETELSEEIISMTALEIALQTALAAASQLGERTLECHERAIDAVRLHRETVCDALEKGENDTVSSDHWQVLGSLSKIKTNALKDAETMAVQLNDVIEKVHMMIAAGREKGLEASAGVAAETLASLTYALQQAKNHLKETLSEGTVLKKFEDYVQEGKEHLNEKLAAIRPELQDAKLEDKADEALLVYAQNRIRILEEGLEQREIDERQVIKEALGKQQKEHEKLTEMRLKHELETLQNELSNEMKLQEAALAEEHENDIRQQLRRQAAVFGDHLNDVLKVQAKDLDGKYQSEKREELLLQRQEFELKLRGNLARLHGVMTALQNRSDIEKANSHAQELWLACQSLSTAITGLGDDRPRLYPVSGEVEKIRRITHGNEVVGTLLDSLPEEALHRGVFPEESLRRRFPLVRKVCKQVAMVGEEGGGVWSYLLSYFQSFLVFDVRAVEKPESLDPEELDTHVILSLATSSLEEGDTEQAVRYMNQLRGEPRRAARDWVQEARLFLEVKQVARFLTAFASAYNIGAEQ